MNYEVFNKTHRKLGYIEVYMPKCVLTYCQGKMSRERVTGWKIWPNLVILFLGR